MILFVFLETSPWQVILFVTRRRLNWAPIKIYKGFAWKHQRHTRTKTRASGLLIFFILQQCSFQYSMCFPLSAPLPPPYLHKHLHYQSTLCTILTLSVPNFRRYMSSVCFKQTITWKEVYTVDSRYLEIQGTLLNTSRYPYFDISDLRNWEKQLIGQQPLTDWIFNLTPKFEIYWKYCGKEEKLLLKEKLLLRSNFSSFPQYFIAC